MASLRENDTGCKGIRLRRMPLRFGVRPQFNEVATAATQPRNDKGNQGWGLITYLKITWVAPAPPWNLSASA
jgi:hypothetical protein